MAFFCPHSDYLTNSYLILYCWWGLGRCFAIIYWRKEEKIAMLAVFFYFAVCVRADDAEFASGASGAYWTDALKNCGGIT